MLHEMIHVKLFQHRLDYDSLNHTQVFLDEVNRVNAMGLYRADVFHDLPRRVIHQLRPYVWRCMSCAFELRLPDSRAPSSRRIHLVERQTVCENPLWVRIH
ncbi:uncharacterized protein LOC122509707 [Leptopilina heterotoma]|uniref:uncharacterized protein LOC122509707 n=1 Tax=Leptopilina heterotoma TaxID=63436 RepID=UPI001CA934A3|nr:uncharacterized protein LOC122509707 [Leptopilina heterotoma]